MKIKKFKFKQILKLHLLKSRAYEHAAKKNNSGFLTSFNLTQVITDFKKALHVIFQYHQTEKRILFIGVPKKLELRINKLTSHVAVPSKFDLQGVISNNFKTLKIVKSNKHSFSKIYSKSLLPKLSKKPDLVVLFSHDKKQNIISETYVAKVPLIIFDNEPDLKETWVSNSYNVQGIGGNLPITHDKSLFFFGLNFLFKTFQKKVHRQTVNKFTLKPLNYNFQIKKKRFKYTYKY
jgi:hypothetical protein